MAVFGVKTFSISRIWSQMRHQVCFWNQSPTKTLVGITRNTKGFLGVKDGFWNPTSIFKFMILRERSWSVGMFMYFPTKNCGAIWNPESLKSQDYFHLPAESIITKAALQVQHSWRCSFFPRAREGKKNKTNCSQRKVNWYKRFWGKI